VRHVRILGLCLVAAFTMSAVALSVASPALAENTRKEKENFYNRFTECPIELGEAVTECIVAQTRGGKEGGEYTVGPITIQLTKKITLQGGINGSEVVGAKIPANGLVSPPLTVPGGFAKRISPQSYWPAPLKESFINAKKNHELGATETLELAGPGSKIFRENLLEENGTAFELLMKVKVSSPWLTSLGGGECHIGSAEHPIVVDLTSGESTGPFPYEYATSHGRAIGPKGAEFVGGASGLIIYESILVNNTYAVTTGVEGCGGAYEKYVDGAINAAAGVPSPSGANSVILTGTLYDVNVEGLERFEKEGY
jgi:hypothetical protein